MTKKDLVKIIREVVKREMKSVVKQQINEVLTEMENSNSKVKEKKEFTSNTTLNSILNETANSNTDEAWPTIGAESLRAKFMGMQDNAIPQTDINNRPVNTSNLDPTLSKALTRDYSELVKRFK